MCKKCGKPVTQTEIFRSSTCQFCGADLHSCINCRFYSPGSHFDCHETIDELVSDKERANFCDSFSLNTAPSASSDSSKARAAKDAFSALFGS